MKPPCHRLARWTAWLALGLPAGLVSCAEAPAPGTPAPAAAVDDGTTAGRAALSRGDFAEARRNFENALTAARRSGEVTRVADALFYLGLTAQQSAASAPDRATALATARRHYLDALRVQPGFPAALNNLAEVYLAENNPSAAGEALRRAVAAGGGREGIYAQKYADLKLQQTDWKEACRYYAHAARVQPDNDAVHRRLVELCLQYDPPALIGYLWMLATTGQVLQVQRIVGETLTARPWTSDNHDEMMTLVAVCLSQQNYAPAEFARTEAAALLRKLPDTPAIRELVELHRGERLAPENYPWWARRARRDEPPPRLAIWPQEGFRQLIRALGARWRGQRGGEDKAIAYYRLAAFLDPREPDPEALTRLAELYDSTSRLGELSEVMRRHENEIFNAKGEAYRTDKLEKIYQFHSALGVIYSRLGVWGDERTPTSAIFQLEQASAVSRRLAAAGSGMAAAPSPGLPDPRPIQSAKPAPQLVNLLAEGYTKTNQPAKAFELKVERGEEYFRAGDVAAAREVLRGADKVMPTTTTATRKTMYEQLQRDIPNVNLPRKTAQTLPVRDATPLVSNAAAARAAATRTEPEPPKQNPAVRAVTQPTPAVANAVVRSRAPLRVTLAAAPGVDAKEAAALGEIVKGLVAKLPANAAASTQTLPREAWALNVQEIAIQGSQGRITLKEGAKTTTVAFTIDGGDVPRGPATTRYVRR